LRPAFRRAQFVAAAVRCQLTDAPPGLPEPATGSSDSIPPSLRAEARVQIGELAERLKPVLGMLAQGSAI